jgi:hypothetical protein
LLLARKCNPSGIIFLCIVGIIREMLFMYFNNPPGSTQSVRQFLAAQVSVYEKDRIRLRGLL